MEVLCEQIDFEKRGSTQVFTDTEKAYDKVPRKALWEVRVQFALIQAVKRHV